MSGSQITMALQGDRAMRRRLEKVAGEKGLRKVARGASAKVGESHILTPARDAAPEKTGRLKRSGRVKISVSSARQNIRITVIFGGPLAPYAAIVHATHPTKAKFLERALHEARRTVGLALAEDIDLRRAI